MDALSMRGREFDAAGYDSIVVTVFCCWPNSTGPAFTSISTTVCTRDSRGRPVSRNTVHEPSARPPVTLTRTSLSDVVAVAVVEGETVPLMLITAESSARLFRVYVFSTTIGTGRVTLRVFSQVSPGR